jgi:hypothetical protein
MLHPVDGAARKGPSPVSRLPACPRTITDVAPLGHERRLAVEAGLKLDEASTVRPVDRLTTLAATGDVLGRFPPQVLDDWTPAPLARRRGSPLMAFHPRIVWMRLGRAAGGAYFRDKRAKVPAHHAINWCVWFKRPVAKLPLHGVADKRCAPQSTFLSVTRKSSCRMPFRLESAGRAKADAHRDKPTGGPWRSP